MLRWLGGPGLSENREGAVLLSGGSDLALGFLWWWMGLPEAGLGFRWSDTVAFSNFCFAGFFHIFKNDQ